MSGGAVARLYDRLCGYESACSKAAYPIHKRLSFDEPELGDVYDWIVRTTPIEPGATVLDAGCGVGYGTEKLAVAADDVRALGISISEAEVRLAGQYAEDGANDAVRFELASFDAVPADRFDVVVAVESLKHSPAVETSLRRLVDALKPGGRLVIVDDFHDGPDDDPMAVGLAETWHLDGLHRLDRYTAVLGPDAVVDEGLSGRVRVRSEAANRLRYAGLSVAAALPGSAGRVARIFRAGVALDRLYARGAMRYLALRYDKPPGMSR